MTISVSLRLEYTSALKAEQVAQALHPDNQNYIHIAVRGNTIYATATASAPGSLRHTLDDFLACLSLSENTGEVLL